MITKTFPSWIQLQAIRFSGNDDAALIALDKKMMDSGWEQ